MAASLAVSTTGPVQPPDMCACWQEAEGRRENLARLIGCNGRTAAARRHGRRAGAAQQSHRSSPAQGILVVHTVYHDSTELRFQAKPAVSTEQPKASNTTSATAQQTTASTATAPSTATSSGADGLSSAFKKGFLLSKPAKESPKPAATKATDDIPLIKPTAPQEKAGVVSVIIQ